MSDSPAPRHGSLRQAVYLQHLARLPHVPRPLGQRHQSQSMPVKHVPLGHGVAPVVRPSLLRLRSHRGIRLCRAISESGQASQRWDRRFRLVGRERERQRHVAQPCRRRVWTASGVRAVYLICRIVEAVERQVEAGARRTGPAGLVPREVRFSCAASFAPSSRPLT